GRSLGKSQSYGTTDSRCCSGCNDHFIGRITIHTQSFHVWFGGRYIDIYYLGLTIIRGFRKRPTCLGVISRSCSSESGMLDQDFYKPRNLRGAPGSNATHFEAARFGPGKTWPAQRIVYEKFSKAEKLPFNNHSNRSVPHITKAGGGSRC